MKPYTKNKKNKKDEEIIYNTFIGIQFDGSQDRTVKTKKIEKEMNDIHSKNYKISTDGDYLICEYVYNNKVFY